MDLTERLKSFELFTHSSDEFIKTLSSICRPRKVSKGTQILTEGQINNHLLILDSGEVEVKVEGERVAVLNRPGDLLGEISVMIGRPVIATIQALTDVEFLEVIADDLDRETHRPGDFGYQIYRLLSAVLAEKIFNTNQKARQFEIANRALVEVNRNLDQKVQERTAQLKASNAELETQNLAILTSHRKLEELYASKDITFQRLNELQSSLIPLSQSLEKVKSCDAAFVAASEQLANSIELLKPISRLYSTEQAIRSKRVLLLEPDRKQQVISKMALGGTGIKLDIAASEDEAREFLKSQSSYDLIFVSSELATFIPELRALAPHKPVVYVASSDMRTELAALSGCASHLANIVSRNPEDRLFTVKNITSTVDKLISKDIFGLEKYMIWGVEVKKLAVKNSRERASLIETMNEHLGGLGVRSSVTDRVATVAEELLMNAIYDAPVDLQNRKAKYAHVNRTEAVELEAPEYAEFKFACDGMVAGISVSDPFGGFKMDTLMNYLKRNYSPETADPQEAGKAGAGRGLHQVVENSDLVVFNVSKNTRTEVIAFFNLDPRSKHQPGDTAFHFFSN